MQENQRSPSEVISALEKYEQMFATEGWRMFIDDIRENAATLFPALMMRVSTEKDLDFAKGRNDVYTYILGLENSIEAVKEQVKNETNDV